MSAKIIISLFALVGMVTALRSTSFSTEKATPLDGLKADGRANIVPLTGTTMLPGTLLYQYTVAAINAAADAGSSDANFADYVAQYVTHYVPPSPSSASYTVVVGNTWQISTVLAPGKTFFALVNNQRYVLFYQTPR